MFVYEETYKKKFYFKNINTSYILTYFCYSNTMHVLVYMHSLIYKMFINTRKHNFLMYLSLKKVIQLQMYIPLFIEKNYIKALYLLIFNQEKCNNMQIK